MTVISRGLVTGGIGPTAWMGLGRKVAGGRGVAKVGALPAPAHPVNMSTEPTAIRLAALPGHWLSQPTVFPPLALRAHRPSSLPHESLTTVHLMAMQITVVRGDITDQHVDAVVNAAKSSLLGGGGVDGAIHRRGGPAILAECRQLRVTRYPDGLAAGQAVATTAGDLPARWVIHTVGPVYSAAKDRSELLVSCYRESLRVADELGAQTVAFPAVSAGAYGWPLPDAARIALTTVAQTRTHVREARFVLFTETAFDAFHAAYPSDMQT
jgi:O-acetyl-ADP-ribose deacetylase (regulator of RNase III)